MKIIINLKLFIHNLKVKKNIKFTYEMFTKLYIVTEVQKNNSNAENHINHYFSNWKRGKALYSGGVSKRTTHIYNQYSLNLITINKSDVIIDVGANYGDIYRSLFNKIDAKNYYAFEPDTTAFKSLIKNAVGANCYNIGLSNKCGKKTLFVDSLNADSSFLKFNSYTHKNVVSAKTLDCALKRKKIEFIKLMKVEAEGYEPEVLVGARRTLMKTLYVAVDAGPERGSQKDITLESVTNYLIPLGFKMLKVRLGSLRVLFLNKNLS